MTSNQSSQQFLGDNSMQNVAVRMAQIINTTLETAGPLLAVSLWFQTGQPEPDVLLCHESLENCMANLLKETEAAAVTTSIARLARTRDEAVAQNRPDWLQGEVLQSRLGPLFNPGDWANPADPAIIDAVAEPEIYAWAKAAFGAIEARYQLPEAEQTPAFYRAEQHIRDVLWAALDEARHTFKGKWPAISFVTSKDDDMTSVLARIAGRGIPLEDQR
jgi:hypothetical protein